MVNACLSSIRARSVSIIVEGSHLHGEVYGRALALFAFAGYLPSVLLTQFPTDEKSQADAASSLAWVHPLLVGWRGHQLEELPLFFFGDADACVPDSNLEHLGLTVVINMDYNLPLRHGEFERIL